MLWCVFFLFSYYAVICNKNKSTRFKMIEFIVASIVINMVPLFIALDVQRIFSGIWVAIFLLIADQARQFNSTHQTWKTYGFWVIICIFHILIPPSFIVSEYANPLNCYSVAMFEFAHNHPSSIYLERESVNTIELGCKSDKK
jgi:hypothetical protein